MRGLSVIVVTLILQTLSCATQTPGKRYEAIRHYNSALSFGSQGNVEGAKNEFELAVKAYPQFPEAWFNLGVAYEKLKIPEQAMEAYKNATTYDENLLEARVGYVERLHEKAVQLESHTLLKKAREQYQKIYFRDPFFPEIAFRYALLLDRIGDQKAAMTAMEFAYQSDPRNAATSRWLAEKYFMEGRYEESLLHFSHLIQDKNADPHSYAGVVRCYRALNLEQEARRSMKIVWKRFSNAPWVLKLESEVRIWPQ